MNSTKNNLKLLPLGKTIIPVTVTQQFMNKVKYLCKCIAREEWSGILFYEPEGSIKNPKTLKFHLKDVYPMNKGTGAFTSYEFDEEFIGYRMDHPETLMSSIGHIHSHNVMGTFFSPTDEEELTDNAPNHNYYLSVIVNNYLDFSIRVAFLVKSKSLIGQDEDGNEYEIKTGEPARQVFYYNCKVELEEEIIPVPKDFAGRTKFIIQDAENKKKAMQKKFADAGKNSSTNKNGKTVNQLALDAINKDADLYHTYMTGFILELLGQNTPIILGDEISTALVRLDKGVEGEHIEDYVASTLSDYAALYRMTFGVGDATTFMEDLTYMMEFLEEENETLGSKVISLLLSGFSTFAEEFENAAL